MRSGIVPPHGWLHRYKFGHRVQIALAPEVDPLPHVRAGTVRRHRQLRPSPDRPCLLPGGPHRDVERRGLRPTGMRSYTPEQRRDVFARSLAEWRQRSPRLRGARPRAGAPVDANGGLIYALGASDVDDPDSRLHDRFEIGIQSRGRYHSVDTGQPMVVPWWGVRVADRVEGRRRMRPLISVVIATYNASHLLHPAIASVRLQDRDDWELVVVSDHRASTTPRRSWRRSPMTASVSSICLATAGTGDVWTTSESLGRARRAPRVLEPRRSLPARSPLGLTSPATGAAKGRSNAKKT